jgi:HlyD family secretion protein
VRTPDTGIQAALGLDRKPSWRRHIGIAILLVAAVAVGGWLWVARTSPSSGETYVTAPAARGDLTVTVTATGTVEPTNLVEISSELSGTVRAVTVDQNDTVEVGQVLAQLDTDKLEAALAHSRAALDARIARITEAEATVAEARAQYERMMTLADQNIASLQSLQAAEAANARAEAGVAVARADAKVAEADLRSDETNLAKACICSPINGVILQRNVDVGQIVASSLQAPVLFTIAEDLSQMELRVDIDEADVGTVKVGNKAAFTIEAYQGRSFPAEIAELRHAPQTIDGVVTYQAVLSIDNTELLLRPGMTATAEIIVESIADAMLVPNAALRFAPPAEPEDPEGGGGGGLLGLLIPRPPGEPASMPAASPADGSRTIWILRGGAPVSVKVRAGATDGLMTVILEGALEEGVAVITEMAGGG